MVEQVVQQGIEARQPYAIEYRLFEPMAVFDRFYEKGQVSMTGDGLCARPFSTLMSRKRKQR